MKKIIAEAKKQSALKRIDSFYDLVLKLCTTTAEIEEKTRTMLESAGCNKTEEVLAILRTVRRALEKHEKHERYKIIYSSELERGDNTKCH